MARVDRRTTIAQADQLKLAEKILGQELKPGRAIPSPFRKDKHPSFNVFIGRDGQLRWKDFACDNGDIYDLAKQAWGTQDFAEVSKKLYAMAGGADAPPLSPIASSYQKLARASHHVTEIQVVKRTWGPEDANYWNGRYRLPIELLEEYGIAPAASVRISAYEQEGKINPADTVITIFHRPENPLYVIQIGQHVKAYRPLNPNRKGRYFGNTTGQDLFGMKQLQEATTRPRYVVFTAGQKDAINATHYLHETRGLSTNAEGMYPEPWMVQEAMQTGAKLFLLYDNDATGAMWSQRIIERYPMITLLKPYPDWPENAKDLSDLVERRCHEAIASLDRQLDKSQ
jgi:hypothetical protein